MLYPDIKLTFADLLSTLNAVRGRKKILLSISKFAKATVKCFEIPVKMINGARRKAKLHVFLSTLGTFLKLSSTSIKKK